ncbi:MAG: polyphosphate polymerase domain-containing protein [Kiritimatiellales bacterium]|nr:polyphosphate polymerase domain-containing protein [Kiritimatiellales bacterium]
MNQDLLKDKLKRQSEFNRYEAKYLIHPSLLPEIRKFIAPFCVNDPHGRGELPEYTITTLQLDSENLDLHYAKANDAVNRFKMRIRTYDAPNCPYFLEIKRKIKGSIAKSRMMIPHNQYDPDLFTGERRIPFRSKNEELTFFNFLRLRDELDLKPIVFIRYCRESYMGRETYSRVTFDRRLGYRRTRSYVFPEPTDRFRSMDSATSLNRPFSGIILELKTYSDVPQWMSDLTERFSLSRCGFCKYSTALNQEALFYGLPTSADTIQFRL